DQLTACDRDLAGGIDAITHGHEGGGIDDSIQKIESAMGCRRGGDLQFRKEGCTPVYSQSAGAVIGSPYPDCGDSGAIQQPSIKPHDAITNIEDGKPTALYKARVGEVQCCAVVDGYAGGTDSRVGECDISSTVNEQRVGKLQRHIGGQI